MRRKQGGAGGRQKNPALNNSLAGGGVGRDWQSHCIDIVKRLQFAHCRNLVVMRCGTCQSTSKQPGVKRKRIQRNQGKQAAAVSVASTENQLITVHQGKKLSGPTLTCRGADVVDLECDFIPLAATKTTSKPFKPAFSLSTSSSSQQPVLSVLPGPRKKKKNKPEAPSNLLNFLSSLND
jgi:hypothetical protein